MTKGMFARLLAQPMRYFDNQSSGVLISKVSNDVGGASSTKRSRNFDRHWCNARTLSSHNPTTLMARSIGDYEVNGTPLPEKGFF